MTTPIGHPYVAQGQCTQQDKAALENFSEGSDSYTSVATTIKSDSSRRPSDILRSIAQELGEGGLTLTEALNFIHTMPGYGPYEMGPYSIADLIIQSGRPVDHFLKQIPDYCDPDLVVSIVNDHYRDAATAKNR